MNTITLRGRTYAVAVDPPHRIRSPWVRDAVSGWLGLWPVALIMSVRNTSYLWVVAIASIGVIIGATAVKLALWSREERRQRRRINAPATAKPASVFLVREGKRGDPWSGLLWTENGQLRFWSEVCEFVLNDSDIGDVEATPLGFQLDINGRPYILVSQAIGHGWLEQLTDEHPSVLPPLVQPAFGRDVPWADLILGLVTSGVSVAALFGILFPQTPLWAYLVPGVLSGTFIVAAPWGTRIARVRREQRAIASDPLLQEAIAVIDGKGVLAT